MGVREKLFGNLDLGKIENDGDFKEASVRAVIIDPIIKELGFTHENILREKALESPFLRTGSKKRKVHLIPDYVFRVGKGYAWILDAKAPDQKVLDAGNLEQAYSYAAHSEIRSNYFALCNGIEFVCFRTADTEKPVLHFRVAEIDDYWDVLQKTLSPASFQPGKTPVYEQPRVEMHGEQFDYNSRPLLEEIPVRKQRAKRHFGCNAYFTRQAWNVVAEYIKNFSQKGDVVLDPFGGSGVTAVEALMNSRQAVHIDLNPLSAFITKALLSPAKREELAECFTKIQKDYIRLEPKTDAEIKEALLKYEGPKDLPLPKGSDVGTVKELFTDEQLAQLSLLKALIQKHTAKKENTRLSLLLAFYNTISIINKTFHETPRGGGNHFGYYYRYRLAPRPANKKTIEVFESKFKRICNGKEEITHLCLLNRKTPEEMMADAQIIKGSATDLSLLSKESVDYIYTDPPYGKKIPYLDLSTIWNAWLGLEVTEADYRMEAIEGGEHNKTKEEYNTLIAKSIEEMYRVLKFDRWLSFVFAHKDPEFWHLIVETCEKCGFEYMGAVPQRNGQTSFKKRQNPFTVLSGELIINFRKARNPRSILKANLGMDIGEIVIQTIEGVIAKDDGATLEQINNELIIKGLELGFLDLLKKEYTDLSPLLRERFEYDANTEKYSIKKDSKFQTHFDVRLRIKYYLISFLRRMERENKNPSFNEIVFAILPLLKNGVTPEYQTILSVLEDIGERSGIDSWRLKKDNPTLFD